MFALYRVSYNNDVLNYDRHSERFAFAGQSQTLSCTLKIVPGWQVNCIGSPFTQRQYWK